MHYREENMLLRSRSGIVASLLCIGSASSASAGQMPLARAQTAPAQPRPAPAPDRPSKPFSNLFQPKVTPSLQTPRVACGMTLVPVNPAFDAKMRKDAPVKPKPSSRTLRVTPCDR
jgi:hypothetical protein